ncbi:hypothetical protein, partial [Escherichia coli]|uniref:hypothetical protein n=1 Tax=Escherichia coli TaxID=562 RepID=UPI001954A980
VRSLQQEQKGNRDKQQASTGKLIDHHASPGADHTCREAGQHAEFCGIASRGIRPEVLAGAAPGLL